MAVRFTSVSIRNLCLGIVGLISVAAGAAVVSITSNGPWGSPDAYMYITLARNLIGGGGLGFISPDGTFHFLSQFPPFYPLVLGAGGLMGINMIVAARWLNILSLALVVFLAGLIMLRHSSARGFSIAAALLLALFPATIRLFGTALSEPLCITLVFLAIFCLLEFLKSKRSRWLVISAIFTGLVPLTRYVGLALIPAAALGILVFLDGSPRERVGKSILFGFLSSLPILIWLLVVLVEGSRSGAAPRWEIHWNGFSRQAPDFFFSLMQFIPRWFPFSSFLMKLQLRYLYGAALVLVLCAVIISVMAQRRSARQDGPPGNDRDFAIFGLFGGWGIAFFIMLALATFFTTAIPAISNRMLLPAYFGLVMSVLAALALWQHVWFRGKRQWLRALPWLLILWGVVFHGSQTIEEVIIPMHAGSDDRLDATSYQWRNSEILKAVVYLPEDIVIISNNPSVIMVWTGRPAYNLIRELEPAFIDQDIPFGADPSDPFQAAFARHGAALVIFEAELPQQLEAAFGEAGPARLETLFTGLVVDASYHEGVIYSYP